MAKQQKIGTLGEDIVCQFLINLGYRILERNWRYSKAEIDIIAMDGNILTFIEVKAKSYTFLVILKRVFLLIKSDLLLMLPIDTCL
ncbi:MAG: YraN family protein [Saprospiraceae bacterium]|nr:YraN family protein [Saprospiraceae bacterium]